MILEAISDLRRLPSILTELRAQRIWPGVEVSQGGYWPGPASATGLDVDEMTALSNTPLWRGISLISGILSCLTSIVERRDAEGMYQRAEGHWLWKILHEEPNPEMTAEVFTSTQYVNKLLYGDRYAEIERGADGRPVALWHLPSWVVRPVRVYKRPGGGLTQNPTEATPEDRRRGGELLYEVQTGSDPIYLEKIRVYHVPGLSLNGLKGIRPIPKHIETIGAGLAMQSSAAAIFGNSTMPLVAIERPREADELNPVGVRNRLAAWEAQTRGVHKRGRAVVMQEGEVARVLDHKLHELQFIENLKHNIPAVANILNLDPYWLGHDGSKNTYSNVESRFIDLARVTLVPHLKADKGETWRKLVPSSEAAVLRVGYNLKELLEPDSDIRSQIQVRYLGAGVNTPDEIARQEGASGIPASEGGRQRFLATNLVPLDQALAGAADENGGSDSAPFRSRLAAMLEAALARVVKREEREIRRAVEKFSKPRAGGSSELAAWARSFYESDLPPFAAAVVSPALGEDAEPLARRLCSAHRAALEDALETGDPAAVLELLNEWKTTAARDLAWNEIDRIESKGERR